MQQETAVIGSGGGQDKWNKIIGGKLLRSRLMKVVWSRGVLAVLGMQSDCWKAYK